MNTLPNPVHGDWADSMAEWAMRNPLVAARPEFAPTQAEVHEVQPQPAECCTELQADPEPAPFVFPLEPILTRHPWLGPVLVALVVIVWTCLDAYLESNP